MQKIKVPSARCFFFVENTVVGKNIRKQHKKKGYTYSKTKIKGKLRSKIL